MTLFFTLFVLSRASDNTISQNIGGTDAWAVPHLKFFGDRPPVPPRSPPMPPRLTQTRQFPVCFWTEEDCDKSKGYGYDYIVCMRVYTYSFHPYIYIAPLQTLYLLWSSEYTYAYSLCVHDWMHVRMYAYVSKIMGVMFSKYRRQWL